MKEKSKVKRMFILDGGTFLYEMGMMKFGKDLDKLQRIFTPFYAFDTDEGWILYDTGWPQEAVPVLEQMGLKPQIALENSAIEQIKKIGIPPADVGKIIVSHLHVDHTGGLQSFPDAEIWVQKDEYSYAHNPNSFNAIAYFPSTFAAPSIKWKLIEGDEVIIPGLTVLLANGHTPGLQGLIVELPESGFYLLGADSAYLKENIEQSLPPGSSWNPILAQYAIKRFKALQRILNGHYFPGHDNDFFTNEVKLAKAYT
jgi:N-acyl homoserine lactone hydrolase